MTTRTLVPIAAVILTATPSPALTPADIARSPARVVLADETAHGVTVERTWAGPVCRSRLVNAGAAAVRVKEVVLFDVPHALPPETQLYGEGFTMLSQTDGTLGHPHDLGLTDRKHYRIPQPDDATTLYGLVTLAPPGGGHVALAFTSCRRFVGRFYVRPTSIQVVIDAEGLTLGPGQSWELEEFTAAAGPDRNARLAAAADRLAANHPPIRPAAVPTGWCSWYCFGPRVTAAQVRANLDAIARDVPGLRYVQIDDGYQPAMGDWLDTGPAFGGNVQGVLKEIRQRGFEPAIWVAPFIAEKGSKLFREHPDWFVKDGDGRPLSADKVTFPGWRRGPWYALDGTHPEAQKHLETVFRTMRREWGVTYFKLDANFWGAIHGGHFHDPAATRVEAYRRGMEAVRRGAGDAFLLGCNHPLWPSLGLVHGSRSSNDIKRTWAKFAGTARQNLLRNWQNGKLWWNDPDCLCLSGDLPADEYRFHAAAIYATGGMLLSGDDLSKLPADRLAVLKKLLPPTGTAAEFEDQALRVGRVRLAGKTVICVLNWDDRPRTESVRLAGRCRVSDFRTGEALGSHAGEFAVTDLPPHSGRLLICEPE